MRSSCRYTEKVMVRDHMHFVVESTATVVDMYFDAVQQMRTLDQSAGSAEPGPAHELPPEERQTSCRVRGVMTRPRAVT